MGAIDVKEMGRWLKEIRLLLGEDRVLVDRIIGGWERGLVEYKELVEERELTDLLGKLREVRVPDDVKCKQVIKDIEKAIDAQVKARGLVAQYAGGNVPDEIWRPKVVSWLSESMNALDRAHKKIVSLASRYEIYLAG